jgi:hypothetical protein
MKVNVGSRKTGYTTQNYLEHTMKHYLDNVADKYEGEFVEENKSFARDFLKGKNLAKYSKLAGAVLLGSIALFGLMSGEVSASTVVAKAVHIDTSPLDRFFKEIYWTMFKVLMYIATPVWAWVGYILAVGGANNEKRTQAKKVGAGLVVGTAITASAPWATRQLFRLWSLVFA